MKLLLFLALCSGIRVAFSDDFAALQSLMKTEWQNYPSDWDESIKFCEWVGITCNEESRVTGMQLPLIGLKGKLSGDIGGLTELTILDLSFNVGLIGPLSAELGKLKNLKTLVLSGCTFTGSIPDEQGTSNTCMHAKNSMIFKSGSRHGKNVRLKRNRVSDRVRCLETSKFSNRETKSTILFPYIILMLSTSS